MMIGMAVILMYSCESPSDYSGPTESTPKGWFTPKLAANTVDVEEDETPYAFHVSVDTCLFNISQEKSSINLNLLLKSDSNPTTQAWFMALKEITLRLNTKLNEGEVYTVTEEDINTSHVGFDIYIWQDPNSKESIYTNIKKLSETTIRYWVDRKNKYIYFDINIKLQCNYTRVEVYKDGSTGNEIPEGKIMDVHTKLAFKYLY